MLEIWLKQVGYADYVLMGDDGRILAVIEAKRTCVDLAKGRQQAKLYADLIEKNQGRRPVVFLTHGLKIDYGNKIGKTIIFAKNHNHAERILEVFGEEYPHLNGYARVIDN